METTQIISDHMRDNKVFTDSGFKYTDWQYFIDQFKILSGKFRTWSFWKIFLESSDEEDEEFAEDESDVVDVEGEYDADVVDVQNNNNVSASQPVTGMIMRTTPNLT